MKIVFSLGLGEARDPRELERDRFLVMLIGESLPCIDRGGFRVSSLLRDFPYPSQRINEFCRASGRIETLSLSLAIDAGELLSRSILKVL